MQVGKSKYFQNYVNIHNINLVFFILIIMVKY
jgi:hypothetical protein